MNNKKLLTNVAVIRPTLIVLLVFYHAFAPYSGAWGKMDGFPEVSAYWWLDWLSYAFMLETFVFVSGYVFGYQVRIKGDGVLRAKKLFISKFKRLIVPSMVFSLLYILLFKDITQPLYRTFYDVVKGVGHMWFLPMLFWCFVVIWIIEKLNLRPSIVLPLLAICSIFSFIPLPFQMTATMYYMLFFYLGYIIQKKDLSFDDFFKIKYCITLVLAFCVLFPTLTMFKENIGSISNGLGISLADNSLITKAAQVSLGNIAKLIYSSVGLVMLFIIIGTFLKYRVKPLPTWLIKVGELCMGVYLLQQFVLLLLYLRTILPKLVGYYWLPWVGFVVALTSSLFLAFIMRKTKVGQFLIG